MIQVEFQSAGPGKCRWCKKDKDEVVKLSFSDGSFVGSYCFADFKKALLDKLEHTAPAAKAAPVSSGNVTDASLPLNVTAPPLKTGTAK